MWWTQPRSPVPCWMSIRNRRNDRQPTRYIDRCSNRNSSKSRKRKRKQKRTNSCTYRFIRTIQVPGTWYTCRYKTVPGKLELPFFIKTRRRDLNLRTLSYVSPANATFVSHPGRPTQQHAYSFVSTRLSRLRSSIYSDFEFKQQRARGAAKGSAAAGHTPTDYLLP